MTTIDANTLAADYFAAWNETDPEQRIKRVEAVWAEAGVFVDPSFEAAGHEELAGLIAGAQQLFPGHVFTLTGQIDQHHQYLRWTWHLGVPGADPVAGGTDIVVTGPDGRIERVIGFLDFAPAH